MAVIGSAESRASVEALLPLSAPHIQGNEWTYVKECLDTEWVSSVGQYVDRFEEKLQEITGAKHAIACSSGTAALQVALQLVGVKPGDEVLAPTLTFIAPINAVSFAGAVPVFMDSDEFFNLDTERTLEFLQAETLFRDGHSWNRRTGRRIAAILPVHVFGNPARLELIVEACRDRNIRIVEDACEAIGSVYREGPFRGRSAGTIGDIGCYSFNGNKIITTGGGGAIVTDDLSLAERARYLTTQAKDDAVHFVHNEIGYNFRLTNVQAAIGLAQAERLREFIAIKKGSYLYYKQEVDTIPGLRIAGYPAYSEPNFWFYSLLIGRQYRHTRDSLMAHFATRQIQTRPIWQLNHLQVPYRECQAYKIQRALEQREGVLNIPCSIGLLPSDRDRVIDCLR